MKRALPALLMLLALPAGAQSFISMGRLFTTPNERAQLDAQRNQAPAGGIAAQPGAAAFPGAGAARSGGPGGPAGSESGIAGAAGAAGMAGMPGAAEHAGGADGGREAAPSMRLDGIIRRSNGSDMIIVNGEVKPAPRRGSQRGAIRLDADGRAIVLKPGQSYDPATGEIHEAAR